MFVIFWGFNMCSHKSCKVNKKVWLPVKYNEISDILPHSWCIHCGLVKNISDDRPKELYYWLNMINLLAKQFSLKQVQKRLISKEIIDSECFNDSYGITGSAQKQFFINLVKKYSKISETSINSLLF